MAKKNEVIQAEGTRLAELVAAHAEVKERLTEIEEEIKTYKPGTYETGEYKVTLAASTRFDKTQFEKDHRPEEYPDFYYDQPTLLTTDLDPELKAAYTKAGATRLTIKAL